jgi:hypothetical protein
MRGPPLTCRGGFNPALPCPADAKAREERDEKMVELIVCLVRNLLQVSDPPGEQTHERLVRCVSRYGPMCFGPLFLKCPEANAFMHEFRKSNFSATLQSA